MITNVIRIKPFGDKEEATLEWMEKMAKKASEMQGYVRLKLWRATAEWRKKNF